MIETLPINKDTMNMFYGREKELIQIDKLLRIYNIAVIEGDYGIGKTSLGNYYRFSKDNITPIEEISTDTRWDTVRFLNEVLKNLLEYCLSEKFFLETDHLRDLVLRYNNSISKDLSLAIMGNQIDVKDKISQEQVQTETGLIYDLKKLANIGLKHNKKLIIQLNNLDLNTSKKEDIIMFFAKNRNIFQIPNIQWILTGSTGLSNLFSSDLKKFSSIIGKPLFLKEMKNDDIFELVKKRFSIDEALLKILINDKDNVRDILNVISIFKTEKLETKKSIKEYFNIFEFDEYEIEILKVLKDKTLSAKQISVLINKSYKTVNNRLKKMILSQSVNKKGSTYNISFEAYCSILE